MKHIALFLLVFGFISHLGFSQKKTEFYFAGNNKPATPENAIRYEVVIEKKAKSFFRHYFIKKDNVWEKTSRRERITVLKDSSLKIIENSKVSEPLKYIRKYKKTEKGYYFKEYYKNGKLKMEGFTTSFFPLHLEGDVKTFYRSGKVESMSSYKDNQMQSNIVWTKNGKLYGENIFGSPDVLAEFPGGEKALSRYVNKNVRYPIIAQENGITGTVLVHFIVTEEGKMCKIHIESCGCIELDREAYRVVASMKAKWKPAILDGKKVKVAFTMPVNFQLN